jgi:hypothetical protein
MAGLLRISDIILNDGWPGGVDTRMGTPYNGFDTTAGGNCVTSPAYPVGTKIQNYDDNTICPGWYTMMYLRFHEGTDFAQDVGDTSDGYGLCFHADGTATGDTTTGDTTYAPWYVVTNDCTNSDATQRGVAAAFPAADLSHNQYGWFWVGGVCPLSDVTSFLVGEGTAVSIKAHADTAIGQQIFVTDDGTNGTQITPYCPTEVFDLTEGADATIWAGPIGWTTNADY